MNILSPNYTFPPSLTLYVGGGEPSPPTTFSVLFVMTEEQIWNFWMKFGNSPLHQDHTTLPDDIEEFCNFHEITVDYYIEEFL